MWGAWPLARCQPALSVAVGTHTPAGSSGGHSPSRPAGQTAPRPGAVGTTGRIGKGRRGGFPEAPGVSRGERPSQHRDWGHRCQMPVARDMPCSPRSRACAGDQEQVPRCWHQGQAGNKWLPGSRSGAARGPRPHAGEPGVRARVPSHVQARIHRRGLNPRQGPGAGLGKEAHPHLTAAEVGASGPGLPRRSRAGRGLRAPVLLEALEQEVVNGSKVVVAAILQ